MYHSPWGFTICNRAKRVVRATIGKKIRQIARRLSSLSAVLSMTVHIFIVLLLHLKTQQEFLTAQATLKRNEFVYRENESALQ